MMTAKILNRQGMPGSKRERVKIVVTLDDGTLRSWWPYIEQGSVSDKDLLQQAVDIVQADLDAAVEAEANMPVERDEIDEVLAKLQGKTLTGKTWDEAKAQIMSAQAVEI